MTNKSAGDGTGASVTDLPVCRWCFNRAREFHSVSGDSSLIFHHSPAGLLRRDVSLIDDSSGTWSARLVDLFHGDLGTTRTAAGNYVLFHVPVRDAADSVVFVAGFAFPAAGTAPSERDLELAAIIMLDAVDAERMRATRFLHDEVAQSLSGVGLQLELLQQEMQPQTAEALKRVAAVQHVLDEVLQLVRQFNAPGQSLTE